MGLWEEKGVDEDDVEGNARPLNRQKHEVSTHEQAALPAVILEGPQGGTMEECSVSPSQIGTQGCSTRDWLAHELSWSCKSKELHLDKSRSAPYGLGPSTTQTPLMRDDLITPPHL